MTWVSISAEGYLDDNSPKPVWKFYRGKVSLKKSFDVAAYHCKNAVIAHNCRAFIIEIGEPDLKTGTPHDNAVMGEVSTT